MSSESDPVVDDVLRSAHAAASPAPVELARALAGIRQRIALPELSLGENGPAQHETELAAPWAGGSVRWATELRRLLGTGLALGVGFALGVQYERRSVPAESAVALQSSGPESVQTPLQTAGPAAAAQLPTPGAETTQPSLALGANESRRQTAGSATGSRQKGAALESRLSRASKHRAVLHGADRVRKHSDPSLPSATEPRPFGFAEVVERVERAQHAERDLRPELAIALLDEVDARAESTILREERLVTRVLADCDLGKLDAARHALAELQSSVEASVYANRIASSCVAPALNGAPSTSKPR